MRKERNTDSFGKERIWIHNWFASLWFNNNAQHKDNCIDATIKFLQDAKRQAKVQGWEDCVVQTDVEGGDCDNLDQTYIRVWGWRQETDKEHKLRLMELIRRERGEKERFDVKKAYFELGGINEKFWSECEKEKKEFGAGSGYEKRINELQKALSKI